MKPLFYIIVRLSLSHIIDNDDPVRSPIIATCDGAKALLSSSIPLRNKQPRARHSWAREDRGWLYNLKFDGLALELNRANFLQNQGKFKNGCKNSSGQRVYEVNSNRTDVALSVGIISKAQQQA